MTAETALCVLAVVQHVAGSCCETDYTLRVSLSRSDSTDKFVVRNPLEALREVAVCVILSEFDAVVKSQEFASQYADVTDESATATDVQGVLLQLSLEDLSDLGRVGIRSWENPISNRVAPVSSKR